MNHQSNSMLTHAQIFELIPAYALDCLDEDELLAVAEHLPGCAQCQSELSSYQSAVDQFPLALAPAEPSPAVKNRLMAEIARRSQAAAAPAQEPWYQRLFAGQPRRAPAWAFASLVVVVLLFASNVLLWRQVNQLQAQEQSTLPIIALHSTRDAPGATGSLVISMDGSHGTLVVDGLPALAPDQQYQLWLIEDGQRTSGGVFSTSQSGYGWKYIDSPLPLASYDGFGITIEPHGGSPAPTGVKVLGT
jgi:anti-sigma-K factor RskA